MGASLTSDQIGVNSQCFFVFLANFLQARLMKWVQDWTCVMCECVKRWVYAFSLFKCLNFFNSMPCGVLWDAQNLVELVTLKRLRHLRFLNVWDAKTLETLKILKSLKLLRRLRCIKDSFLTLTHMKHLRCLKFWDAKTPEKLKVLKSRLRCW